MRYQLEYHPNPDCMSINMDKQLTKEMIQRFEDENWDSEKMPPFVKDLFSVAGIISVSLKRYELSLVKGSVFSWDEITENVIFVLQMHLEPEGKAEEIATPIKYHFGKDGYMRDIPQPVKGKLRSSKIFKEEKDSATE